MEIRQPSTLEQTPVDLEFAMADSGAVTLADFGRVASTVRRPHGDASDSSPEILMGFKPDGRSSLFSLGLIMMDLVDCPQSNST